MYTRWAFTWERQLADHTKVQSTTFVKQTFVDLVTMSWARLPRNTTNDYGEYLEEGVRRACVVGGSVALDDARMGQWPFALASACSPENRVRQRDFGAPAPVFPDSAWKINFNKIDFFFNKIDFAFNKISFVFNKYSFRYFNKISLCLEMNKTNTKQHNCLILIKFHLF